MPVRVGKTSIIDQLFQPQRKQRQPAQVNVSGFLLITNEFFPQGVTLSRCSASYQPNVPQMSAVAIGVFNQSRGSKLKGKLASTKGARY